MTSETRIDWMSAAHAGTVSCSVAGTLQDKIQRRRLVHRHSEIAGEDRSYIGEILNTAVGRDPRNGGTRRPLRHVEAEHDLRGSPDIRRTTKAKVTTAKMVIKAREVERL